jgi:hypothetical protein
MSRDGRRPGPSCSAHKSLESWAEVEQESLWAAVMALEPRSSRPFVRAEQLVDVALAIGDFADLKSPFSAGLPSRGRTSGGSRS